MPASTCFEAEVPIDDLRISVFKFLQLKGMDVVSTVCYCKFFLGSCCLALISIFLKSFNISDLTFNPLIVKRMERLTFKQEDTARGI